VESRLVVLDTNVVVSGLLSAIGSPARILQAVLDDEIAVAWSRAILDEYREVLARPRFGFSQDDIAAVIDHIEAFGQECEPSASATEMPDEDDRVFYDTAVQARAILVTGNTRHFPKAAWIQTPTEFLVARRDALPTAHPGDAPER
jgi:putative PIN family toxin of toxin-antitoxin system